MVVEQERVEVEQVVEPIGAEVAAVEVGFAASAAAAAAAAAEYLFAWQVASEAPIAAWLISEVPPTVAVVLPLDAASSST
ncbi:hypothetical protein G6F68_020593 [Rhizopus microsporus]|nr:hypothetical protein G6F68_020593 [Rhizopus microsporus]